MLAPPRGALARACGFLTTFDLMAGTKSCTRCGATFVCRVDDLPHCQCFGISLAPALLAMLQETYIDCLCSRCLEALADNPRGDNLLAEPNP